MKGYSQHDEDEVLTRLIAVLNPRRWCAEVGVSIENGEPQCNTLALLEQCWQGNVIDVECPWHPLLKGYLVSERVTVGNFASILEDLHIPHDLGVLSIDVDGIDYWLWRSLPLHWRPSIVVIEYNACLLNQEQRLTVPHDPDFRWDGSDWFGATAGAMVSLADVKGYVLAAESCHSNLFFVRRGMLPLDWPVPKVASLGGQLLGRNYRHAAGKEWVKV